MGRVTKREDLAWTGRLHANRDEQLLRLDHRVNRALADAASVTVALKVAIRAMRLLVHGIERLAEQLPAQIQKRAHERRPPAPPDARLFSRRRANTVISLAACLSPFFSATSMPLR